MSRGTSAEALLDAARERLESDPDEALRLARRAVEKQETPDAWYVVGLASSELGLARDAIEAFGHVLDLDPGDHDARAALSRELFDVMDWDEARVEAGTVLREDPLNPEALYVRACLRERRGDHDGAARDYTACALADPTWRAAPVELTDADVDEIFDEVVTSLHPTLQRYLLDVPVILEEVPSDEVLLSLEPPGQPADLLGCFSGASLPDRSGMDPWSNLPATILLFRRNLARLAAEREVVRDELRVTLLHEIGHFLGLDEEELARRGLD